MCCCCCFVIGRNNNINFSIAWKSGRDRWPRRSSLHVEPSSSQTPTGLVPIASTEAPSAVRRMRAYEPDMVISLVNSGMDLRPMTAPSASLVIGIGLRPSVDWRQGACGGSAWCGRDDRWARIATRERRAETRTALVCATEPVVHPWARSVRGGPLHTGHCPGTQRPTVLPRSPSQQKRRSRESRACFFRAGGGVVALAGRGHMTC